MHWNYVNVITGNFGIGWWCNRGKYPYLHCPLRDRQFYLFSSDRISIGPKGTMCQNVGPNSALFNCLLSRHAYHRFCCCSCGMLWCLFLLRVMLFDVETTYTSGLISVVHWNIGCRVVFCVIYSLWKKNDYYLPKEDDLQTLLWCLWIRKRIWWRVEIIGWFIARLYELVNVFNVQLCLQQHKNLIFKGEIIMKTFVSNSWVQCWK